MRADDIRFHIAREVAERRRAIGARRDTLEPAVSMRPGSLEIYERAARDIPAADLWRIARHLGRPMRDFFPAAAPATEPQADVDMLPRLTAAFARIEPAGRRRALIAAAAAIAAYASDRDHVEGEADATALGAERDRPVIKKGRK